MTHTTSMAPPGRRAKADLAAVLADLGRAGGHGRDLAPQLPAIARLLQRRGRCWTCGSHADPGGPGNLQHHQEAGLLLILAGRMTIRNALEERTLSGGDLLVFAPGARYRGTGHSQVVTLLLLSDGHRYYVHLAEAHDNGPLLNLRLGTFQHDSAAAVAHFFFGHCPGG